MRRFSLPSFYENLCILLRTQAFRANILLGRHTVDFDFYLVHVDSESTSCPSIGMADIVATASSVAAAFTAYNANSAHS